ncbi:hypothetical protein Tco_0129505 [Tanacetum coccineum]
MHGCSYKTFMNGKPHSFKGTEGVVMTSEVAMCTLEGRALTWWNGNTLTLKGDDIEAYSNRFHELVLMCPELVSTERKKFEKYIHGFPERIKGNITSSKPATLHDAIIMACELVEQSVQGRAARIGPHGKVDCRVRLQGAGNDFCRICDMFRVVVEIRHLQGQVSELHGNQQNDGARGRIVRISLPNGKILEVQRQRSQKRISRSLACIKEMRKKLVDIRGLFETSLRLFPDDMLGLPSCARDRFRIDMIPGAHASCLVSIRLSPTETVRIGKPALKELQWRRVFIRTKSLTMGTSCSVSSKKEVLLLSLWLFLEDSLTWDYHQFRVERDIRKTAFRLDTGTLSFTVMHLELARTHSNIHGLNEHV